jgi:hypothetical protein
MHYPQHSEVGEKRLNRVFDAIGFVYPDYRYPLRGQGKKRKAATSATPDKRVPKGKKLNVLTHRPRYIELAAIPEFGEGTSSAAKIKETIAPVQRTEEPAIMPKVPLIKVVETKIDKANKPKTEETMKMPEVLSPPVKATVPKVQMGSVVTPKRRMVNVLDVLETTETLDPASTGKVVEASRVQTKADTKQIEVEAAGIEAGTDAGPSESAEKKPAEIEEKATEEKATEQISAEKVATPAPEALKESIDYIIHHASGKGLSQEEKGEAQHYAQKLKYLKGALVFNGSGEEDFLYCLPDNKEISVCREIGRSVGFPKLEDGL